MSKRLYREFPEGTQPVVRAPAYIANHTRAPQEPPIRIPESLSEITGPRVGYERLWESADDLTRQVQGGVALGRRIIVFGRVTDDRGRPVPKALIEVWQANSAGRYRHASDHHAAPVDPNFIGRGALLTDDDGSYQFITIEPGPYPWANHHNAWRPRHIHFSFFGLAQPSRLVTQMYFPGDPLLPLDPIFMSIPDERARERLVCTLDMDRSAPRWALAYRFDVVLRGPEQTPWESTL